MIRISRDGWLGIGLVALMLAVTFAAAQPQNQAEGPPPYASFSSAPDGTLALARWLDELGYDVSSDVDFEFEPPEDTAVIAILQPSTPITSDEWDLLDQWVSEGGTLVLAGENFAMSQAVAHYQFSLAFFETPQDVLTIQAPLLISPPVRAGAAVHAMAHLTTDRTDYVTHLAAQGQPVVISFRRAAGRVVISTAPFPLSNQGLKDETNPPLALNLMTATDKPGQIWFDEWHHGVRPTSDMAPGGPESWLFGTQGGRALLYAAAVVFVALLLQGRSFGKPLPQTRDRARRAPLEYITAIANLNRRAGHRRALLADYHYRLKRDLGRRYRLSPSLDDAEFAKQLGVYRPDLNAQDLLALLSRLRQPVSSENDMVELTARVAAWLDERSGNTK
jgi:hypothetical protein